MYRSEGCATIHSWGDGSERIRQKLFHKVYREISEQLGIETALTIHQMFKGTQVNFPVRFFDTQCVKEMIIKEYDGTNVKTLAKKYDYSEKSVRRIIKESTKKK